MYCRIGGGYRSDFFGAVRLAGSGCSEWARTRRHQEHSGLVMTELHTRLEAQIAGRKAEPNSRLGEAIQYLLRHWRPLRQFLRVAGAPLDNNLVERALKRAVLHRNYVHFPITDSTLSEGGKLGPCDWRRYA